MRQGPWLPEKATPAVMQGRKATDLVRDGRVAWRSEATTVHAVIVDAFALPEPVFLSVATSFFGRGLKMNKNVFIALGAAALILGTTSTVLAAECTVPLPNARWSYDESTTTQVAGELHHNPGAPNNDNLFVAVITMTRCAAINPGGQEDEDHSYVKIDGIERVLVCNQIVGLTPEGAALGFSEADCS